MAIVALPIPGQYSEACFPKSVGIECICHETGAHLFFDRVFKVFAFAKVDCYDAVFEVFCLDLVFFAWHAGDDDVRNFEAFFEGQL